MSMDIILLSLRDHSKKKMPLNVIFKQKIGQLD